jgi:hypothetical protein
MNRDMKLIRLILEQVAEGGPYEVLAGLKLPEEYDRLVICRHLELIRDADLTIGVTSTHTVAKSGIEIGKSPGEYSIAIQGLTWKGYDVLDNLRERSSRP